MQSCDKACVVRVVGVMGRLPYVLAILFIVGAFIVSCGGDGNDYGYEPLDVHAAETADARAAAELSERYAEGPGRHGAMLALAGRLPAPILAERLGIHQACAAQWVCAAGATYSSYVESRVARDGGDVP
jgi:hypothetical protein